MTHSPVAHFVRYGILSLLVFTSACTQAENGASNTSISQLSVTETIARGEACENGGVQIHVGYDHSQDGILDSYEINSTETVCFESAQTVSRSLDIAPGEECPAGGVRVQSGDDLNDNGVLDDLEVKSETVTCFPETALPGSSLISVTEEAPGENCADGGTRISTGIDDNQNSILDADEIDAVEFICNDPPIIDPQPLVDVTDEEPGDNCEYGGTRISSGNDDNSDGVLDADEVDSVDYICDSPPPQAPPATLVRVDTEEPGANCPIGGTRVSTGVDDDLNGLLDDEEIDSTQYICTPEVESPPPALVITETVDPGPDCPAGGSRVISGLDLNEDDNLSEDEIDSATYICNGIPGDLNADLCVNGAILEGAVSISAPEDMEMMEGVVCVLGALIIDGSTLTNLAGLESLVEISSDLVISNNSILSSLEGLDNLAIVKGAITLQNNLSLIDIVGMNNLEDVKGGLAIKNNTTLQTITGFQSLHLLTGSLSIQNNDELFSVNGFSNLNEVAALQIDENPSMLTLGAFSALEQVKGSMFVYEMNGLAAVEFTQLHTVMGILIIRYHDGPTLASFPSLSFLGGSLLVENNNSLESVEIPLLTWSGGDLWIISNPNLQQMRATELLYLSGFGRIHNNPSLTDVTLDSLTTIGGYLYFYNNDSIEDFSGLSALTSIGEWFLVRQSPALTSLLGLESLIAVAGYFKIQENSNLASVSDLGALQTVGGDFEFTDNTSMSTALIDALSTQISIGGTITITNNLEP
jgi:hypothetical protein